jgi:DNA-binding NtrC family response regulator
MSKILVVDKDRSVLTTFRAILDPLGHEVVTVGDAAGALEQLQRDPLSLVILDVCLPDMDGLEVLRRIKQSQPPLPVIVIASRGTVEMAIEATKLGAFDYQLKPFQSTDMLRIVKHALEGVRIMRGRGTASLNHIAANGDALIGRSAAMQELYKAIGRVAATDATVLVRGESGTGKELVARAVFQHSLRCDKPLLIVNCAAIPETLLEGELFGYERGAFTGAVSRRIGKLEHAHTGTVFLDEVGDVPLSIQGKILRVLQERCFERLGGNETIPVDVRVLSATNRDLERAMADGEFRADLYHRLNVVTVRVPPLRERREDIPLLVDYFLERFAHELNSDKPPLSDDALELLCRQSWPGNVRELRHCIHRALIFTRGYCIQAADLPLTATRPADDRSPECLAFDQRLQDLVQDYLRWFGGRCAHEQFVESAERLLLAEALRRNQGNRSHAARLLGLPRPTLHTKLQKHGMLAVREVLEPEARSLDTVRAVQTHRSSRDSHPTDATTPRSPDGPWNGLVASEFRRYVGEPAPNSLPLPAIT